MPDLGTYATLARAQLLERISKSPFPRCPHLARLTGTFQLSCVCAMLNAWHLDVELPTSPKGVPDIQRAQHIQETDA